MSWTVKSILETSAEYLKGKAIENPRLTAEVLLAHQLGMDRLTLYLRFDQPLTETEVSGYRGLIRRRIAREPLQYITATREFWSLSLYVDHRVLIPRPETEVLVEQALRILRSRPIEEARPPELLDLGTGAGPIAIALATELTAAQIWATDFSPEALEVARMNAEAAGVLERIRFLHGDLWEALDGTELCFDMILSNPPYVSGEAFEALAPEIRDHEPRAALDGGTGGLRFISAVIEGAPGRLKPGGWLLVEMSPEQMKEAVRLIEASGLYKTPSTVKDYGGMDRVLMARKR